MKQRELKPFFRIVWQFAGAWIALCACFLFSVKADIRAPWSMIFVYGGFLFPMLVGSSWVREISIPNAESCSRNRYRVSLALTAISFFGFPFGIYLHFRPVYLSEEQLSAAFSRHKVDLEQLVFAQHKQQKLELSVTTGYQNTSESSDTAKAAVTVAQRLLRDEVVTFIRISPDPPLVRIDFKIPRGSFLSPDYQGIVYVEKLPKEVVLLGPERSLIQDSKKGETVCKRIDGNWYMYLANEFPAEGFF